MLNFNWIKFRIFKFKLDSIEHFIHLELESNLIVNVKTQNGNCELGWSSHQEIFLQHKKSGQGIQVLCPDLPLDT